MDKKKLNINTFFNKILINIKNKKIRKEFLIDKFNLLKNKNFNFYFNKFNLSNIIDKNFFFYKNFLDKEIFYKIINKIDFNKNYNFIIFYNGYLIKNIIKIEESLNIKEILEINTKEIINIKKKTKDNKFLKILENLINKKYIIKIYKNKNLKKPLQIININFNNTNGLIISNSYLEINLYYNSSSEIIEHYININENNLNIYNRCINLYYKSKLNYFCIYNDNINYNYNFSNYILNLNKNAILKNNLFMINSSNIFYNIKTNLKKKSIYYINNFSYSKKKINIIKSIINHIENKSKSYQLNKFISKNYGINIFENLVRIKKNILFIDGNIYSYGILNSDNSKIIIIPKLEINTDSVDFEHGTSIGDIDYKKIFYFNTRCINYENSIKIILFSFLNDIISKIDNIYIKNYLYNKIINII